MDSRAKRDEPVEHRRSGQRAIRSRLGVRRRSLKPGLILIRCNSRMARHRLPRTEACRSTTRARITTPATQARSTIRWAILGVSSDALGTLTFFRQNALTLDGVFAYDPMAASYAFSALGFSSSNCGAGDTETCRITTAIKYRVNYRRIPNRRACSSRRLRLRTTVRTATTRARSAATSRSAISAGATACCRSTPFTNGKRTQ